MWQSRSVCQTLLLLVLSAQAADQRDDTDTSGAGSYSIISTGQPVRPEQPAVATGPQIKSKAQYTRTALHVARSLDPAATETMQVRTRTGDIATLIVKRRSRTGGSTPPPSIAPPSPTVRTAKAAPVSSDVRVPDPVDIRSSPVLVKSQPGAAAEASPKRARSLLKVDTDGIPVIEGVRVPDDENDKKYTWRNARVINGILVPNSAASRSATSNETATGTPTSTPASLGDASVQKLSESTAQSPWIPTSPDGANVVSPPLLTPLVVLQTRDEQQRRILEYIRAVNQLEAGRAAGAMRARMLRNTEAPEAEARVLHYQPALLYSAQSTNPSRVSFEEGVRTPVLHYAHPELGVQPAKVAPPSPRNQDRALAYFAQDIHSDRSPFLREPGLDLPEPEDPVKPVSAKRSSESLPQRPKKGLLAHPQEDSYGLASDKYVKRFPHAMAAVPYKDYRDYKDDYSSGYGYRYNYRSDPHYSNGYSAVQSPFLEDSRPFWVRLSDTIRDSMQTGMERVSDLARPVVDPLVEASAKISQNLGFSSGGPGGLDGGHRGAQDRLGSVVGAPSMLLPALGLVAGGAALGLGAVAVGRYLDVDVMAKRSETSDEEALEMEHKRALNAVAAGSQVYLDQQQGQTPTQEETADGNSRQVIDADVVAQIVNVVNAQKQKEQQQNEQQQQQQQPSKSRRRRTVDADNQLDSWQDVEERRRLALRAEQLGTGAPTALWGSTPCAQRIFCEVLSKEGHDAALQMEKKMSTFLAMLPRVGPEAAAVHLSAVMAAVRRGDCSQFACPLGPLPALGPQPRR